MLITLQHVELTSFEALRRFLDRVPRSYYQHILKLDISTLAVGTLPVKAHPRTDAVLSLLDGTPRLRQLSLHLDGGLANHVIPTFSKLAHLKQLSISNCGSEEKMPMYVHTHYHIK